MRPTEWPASHYWGSGVLGGTVSGTYTIPRLAHCLLVAPLINLMLPGPDNAITVTLGAATSG